MPVIDHGLLDWGITKSSKAMHIRLSEMFKTKIIQLYETIQVRHGLMVVGEPFGGKSTILQILRDGWAMQYKLELFVKETKKEIMARYRNLIKKGKDVFDIDDLELVTCKLMNGRYQAGSHIFSEEENDDNGNNKKTGNIGELNQEIEKNATNALQNQLAVPESDILINVDNRSIASLDDEDADEIDWSNLPEHHVIV